METLLVETLPGISQGSMVTAVLVGGPAYLPQDVRTRRISLADEKIKIPHWGGFEHFERVSKADAREHQDNILFRWTMRTEIAE